MQCAHGSYQNIPSSYLTGQIHVLWLLQPLTSLWVHSLVLEERQALLQNGLPGPAQTHVTTKAYCMSDARSLLFKESLFPAGTWHSGYLFFLLRKWEGTGREIHI